MDTLLIIGIIGAIVGVILLFAVIIPIPIWLKAVFSGVSLSLASLVGMRFRNIPPGLIADALIAASKAGLEVKTDQLETHYLAGGNILKVTRALIAASKAGIDLTFEQCTAIDLAGREVFEAVQTSVNPKVIDCPKNGKIAAVAKDGIQLLSKARVTVRTNIERLVGGATEDTIIARVGEGIVSAIGSADSFKTVLENPDNISKTVLNKGLDSGTAYEILSIDIADIDVGQNIGALLQTDQAEADLKVAQARAETRRAMAIAEEQEMSASVEKMRAKVIEAEAKIPLAIAEAFRSGNLGIMDYYKLKNIEADTQMRDSISTSGTKSKDSDEERKS
jgi:uncharacterized protein YqfA (UPF0365 family)